METFIVGFLMTSRRPCLRPKIILIELCDKLRLILDRKKGKEKKIGDNYFGGNQKQIPSFT